MRRKSYAVHTREQAGYPAHYLAANHDIVKPLMVEKVLCKCKPLEELSDRRSRKMCASKTLICLKRSFLRTLSEHIQKYARFYLIYLASLLARTVFALKGVLPLDFLRKFPCP